MTIIVSDIEYVNDLDEEYHQDMEIIIRDLELEVPDNFRDNDSALESLVTETIMEETGFIPSGFVVKLPE